MSSKSCSWSIQWTAFHTTSPLYPAHLHSLVHPFSLWKHMQNDLQLKQSVPFSKPNTINSWVTLFKVGLLKNCCTPKIFLKSFCFRYVETKKWMQTNKIIADRTLTSVQTENCLAIFFILFYFIHYMVQKVQGACEWKARQAWANWQWRKQCVETSAHACLAFPCRIKIFCPKNVIHTVYVGYVIGLTNDCFLRSPGIWLFIFVVSVGSKF